MLQQTKVETVLPYFERWMRQFPDFANLAHAGEPEVLKAWEGLGYYSRARNLHRLAASIMAEGIPDSPEAWKRRPGIGPYTAAAICSISQGLPEPVIDGNVIRVLCRLTRDARPIRSSAEAHRRLDPLARRLIDRKRPGDYNQALMELGATVCRKSRPACLLCPVRAHCRASRQADPAALPVMVRQATRQRSVARLFSVEDGQLLLEVQAPESRRLAGLAELPLLETAPESPPLLSRTRAIGRDRLTEHLFVLPAVHPAVRAAATRSLARWVPLAQLPRMTLSAPHKRWIPEALEQLDTRKHH